MSGKKYCLTLLAEVYRAANRRQWHVHVLSKNITCPGVPCFPSSREHGETCKYSGHVSVPGSRPLDLRLHDANLGISLLLCLPSLNSSVQLCMSASGADG